MMRHPAELDADLSGPVDDDLLLAGDCMLGHASAEQEAEFERRYAEDDAFHEKVAPLVAALLAPVNYEKLFAEANAGAAEASAQSRYAAAAPPGRSRVRWLNDFLFIGVRIMAAASVIVAGVWVYAMFSLTNPTPPATVISTIPVTKAAPVVAPPSGSKTPAPAVAAAAASEQPVRRRSVTYLRFLDLSGDSVQADSSADKIVETATGTHVLVRRGSAFRHTSLPGATFTRTLEVKGEIAIAVGGEDMIYQVVSRAGVVLLTKGSYALRCVASCAALEVSVGSGMAVLHPDRVGSSGVPLIAGQYGRAFRDSASVMVPAAAAANFPALDSAFTARALAAKAALRKAP